MKDRIALELLPYVKPKLRSVDLNLTGQVRVKVVIGGSPMSRALPTDRCSTRRWFSDRIARSPTSTTSARYRPLPTDTETSGP